jgi:hypothetical protein
MSDSHRRSAPISCALDGCENARHTNGYASAFRNRQNIKILAHLIHQNRSSWAQQRYVHERVSVLDFHQTIASNISKLVDFDRVSGGHAHHWNFL